MCEGDNKARRHVGTGARRDFAPKRSRSYFMPSGLCAFVPEHLPEYACEMLLLGLFMVSASIFGIVLFHPHSPAVHMIASPLLRRAIMGVAMGLTGIAL